MFRCWKKRSVSMWICCSSREGPKDSGTRTVEICFCIERVNVIKYTVQKLILDSSQGNWFIIWREGHSQMWVGEQGCWWEIMKNFVLLKLSQRNRRLNLCN